MRIVLHAVLLLALFLMSEPAIGAQDKDDNDVVLSAKKPEHSLFIRQELTQLASLDSSELSNAQQAIKNLENYQTAFNAAENFLFNQLRAQQALSENNPRQSLIFIEEGEQFLERVSEQQQASREFAKSCLIKSQAHQALGQFKEAYESKHQYLKKYSNSFAIARQQEIAELSEKYELTKKEKANELLESQNELTHLKIVEVEKERATYERNKGILLAVTLVFILMLSRQITVSRRLKRMSRRDHLTGIYNRRTLFERGQALMEKHVKSGETFCVILFDVDHFKKINDTYGHVEGDKVLKQVTKVAGQALRSRDIFARIGGEEFVVLLPEATFEETKAIAEHMREKIQSHTFPCFQSAALISQNDFEGPHQITASFGLTCSGFVQTDFDQLIHVADQSMYQSKLAGRNTVTSFAGTSDNLDD